GRPCAFATASFAEKHLAHGFATFAELKRLRYRKIAPPLTWRRHESNRGPASSKPPKKRLGNWPSEVNLTMIRLMSDGDIFPVKDNVIPHFPFPFSLPSSVSPLPNSLLPRMPGLAKTLDQRRKRARH